MSFTNRTKGPMTTLEGWLFIGLLIVTSPLWFGALAVTAGVCWVFRKREDER